MATPEQVRQAVVRAAIPLVGEYETLTTARIAREAGVEESDLVAVFPDTDAVLQACVATMTARLTAAMDPAAEIRALAAIRVDQPLASRLAEAFLTFSHVGSRTALRTDQVVDLFLHGALRTP